MPRPKPTFNVQDIDPGATIEGDGWKATSAEVHHVQPFLQSLAYRFDTSEGSICLAGDTDSVDIVTALAEGCEVVVANCWDFQQTMDANDEAEGQTGTHDAANMAKGAGAKTLVLTHTGPALVAEKDKALADVASIFDGKIIFAGELMTVDLY